MNNEVECMTLGDAIVGVQTKAGIGEATDEELVLLRAVLNLREMQAQALRRLRSEDPSGAYDVLEADAPEPYLTRGPFDPDAVKALLGCIEATDMHGWWNRESTWSDLVALAKAVTDSESI